MAKIKLGRIKIQPAKDLEGNFAFITDSTLRTNISIATQYLFFLISLDSEYDLPGPIIYSVYKNMIVYLASITEALINYTLKELIQNSVVKNEDIVSFEWKCDKSKEIITLDDGRVVKGVIEHKSFPLLTSETQFVELNKAAKRSKLFDESLYSDADHIRTKRNKIHIAGLKDLDDNYSRQDVIDTTNEFTHIFNRTKEVLESKPMTIE
ncbi:TPA: hypothetical protein DD455_02795 [Candidatus Shapirobacteria bacterium]|nr:hypothetical protein [Candidatus Shapirobacteria bacterium]